MDMRETIAAAVVQLHGVKDKKIIWLILEVVFIRGQAHEAREIREHLNKEGKE